MLDTVSRMRYHPCMTSTTTFLHILWEHLCSWTTDPQDRLVLLRTAKACPITGGLHGWHR